MNKEGFTTDNGTKNEAALTVQFWIVHRQRLMNLYLPRDNPGKKYLEQIEILAVA